MYLIIYKLIINYISIFYFVKSSLFITEKIIKYLIEDYYEEDYNPYTAENWQDNYCFQYSFTEWYYLYRLQARLGVY
jgi:hypothetical protein